MAAALCAATLAMLVLATAQADPDQRPLSLRGIPPCRSCAAGLAGLGLGGLGAPHSRHDHGLGLHKAGGLASGLAWGLSFVPLPAVGEDVGDGLLPDVAVLQSRLYRQGRSGGPFWPLRHPAAVDARKRHRDAPGFLHPVVRFVQPLSLTELGGGPYVGGDDGWGDEPARPLLDNIIRDTPLDKARPLTAEELIRALQEKQLRQSEETGSKASALRFGGMMGRK